MNYMTLETYIYHFTFTKKVQKPLVFECGFFELPNKAISAISGWNFMEQSMPLNSITLKTYIYSFTLAKKVQKPLRYHVLMEITVLGRPSMPSLDCGTGSSSPNGTLICGFLITYMYCTMPDTHLYET